MSDNLLVLGPPDLSSDEEPQRTERDAQWRLICIDLQRFRVKNPEKAKVLIRHGIPEFLRGAVWLKLARVRELAVKYPDNLYERMRVVPEAPCEGDIIRDIHRTFPKHVLFRDRNSLGQGQLFNVLRAYSVFNPEVGYCQGMGFIAGLLLMYLNEENSFMVLVALLETYNMSGLFKPDLPLLKKYFFQLQRLIQIHLPLLYDHLQNQGVEPTMYASQWFMTVCIYNFPFATVSRVWDIFLAEGVKIIFRIALAILKLSQDAILQASFEQILHILKMASVRSDSEVLIQVALSMKLKNKLLKALENEFLSYENIDGRD